MTIGALWGNLGNQLPRQVYTGVYSFLLYTLIIVSQAPFYENLASPLVNELWVWELVHFWKLDKGSCFLLEKLNLALCSSILISFSYYLLSSTCWLPIYFASRNTMIHVPFQKSLQARLFWLPPQPCYLFQQSCPPCLWQLGAITRSLLLWNILAFNREPGVSQDLHQS